MLNSHFHRNAMLLIISAFFSGLMFASGFCVAFAPQMPIHHIVIFSLLCGISTAVAEYCYGKGIFKGRSCYVFYGLTVAILVVGSSVLISKQAIRYEWITEFILIALFASLMCLSLQRTIAKQERKRLERK